MFVFITSKLLEFYITSGIVYLDRNQISLFAQVRSWHTLRSMYWHHNKITPDLPLCCERESSDKWSA